MYGAGDARDLRRVTGDLPGRLLDELYLLQRGELATPLRLRRRLALPEILRKQAVRPLVISRGGRLVDLLYGLGSGLLRQVSTLLNRRGFLPGGLLLGGLRRRLLP